MIGFRLLVAALGLSLCFDATAASAQADAGQPTTVRFGYLIGIPFPTLFVAEEMGYLKAENIQLDKITMAGSGPITEALAAGNLDIGNTTPMLSILATAKGGREMLVAANEQSFTDKAGKSYEAGIVVVRQGEGIKSMTDLRGKRIAVNDLGSYQNYLVRAYFIDHTIDPDKDVTIVPIPFGQMGPALVQKQVDAIMGSADDYQQVKARIPVDAIDTATHLEQVDVSLAGALGVNTDFLRDHRDVVVRFLRAFLRARQWLNAAAANNDPAAPALIAKIMKYSPARSQLFWDTRGSSYGKELDFVNELDVQKRLVAQDVKILKTIGLLKPDADIPYDRAVDIGPLRDASASLGIKWDESKH